MKNLEKPETKSRFEKIKMWVGPIFVLVMLVAAFVFLHMELKEHSIQDIKAKLVEIPLWKLILASVLTVLNYAILVCYDWLGIWYIRHPMKFGRVALASFLGYSVGNNFGLLFGGSTIRYRLYSTWGLSAAEIVQLLFILAISFWIGLFALSGLVFLIAPLDIPDVVSLPFDNTRPIGWILTTLAAVYLLVSFIGKPLKFGSKEFHPPPFGLSVAQYLVSAIDLLVAAAIVYFLLPESIEMSYAQFVGVFLLAQVAVFVTQVPGGLGVFEACLLALLAAGDPEKTTDLFAALVVYRLLFYLMPMGIGIAMLGAHEVIMHRENLKEKMGAWGVWTPDIAPRIAALVVFFGGACMLIAAALPVEDVRMSRLNSLLPLWFIEISYFLCGIAGVLLLLLSRGLYRRIATAYYLTLPTLAACIMLALVSSLGFWQMTILMTAFCVVAPIRHYFHRRGKLLTDQVAWHWLVGIAVVLLLSAWIFWFAYKKRDDLNLAIWQFALDADAPRSLRALLGASLFASGFYITRILQISLGRPETTTHREIRSAREIVKKSIQPSSINTLSGDKRLIFNELSTAFVAYAEHSRSAVALGNPVGPTEEAIQMAWDFQESSLQQSNSPVFYLVDDRYATLYQEMNLQLFHIADLAMVDVRQSTPVTDTVSPAHETWKKIADDGFECAILEDSEEIESILPDLERIDEAWNVDRSGVPLKFSIHQFHRETIATNPVAVFEKAGRIVAFASLPVSADQSEVAFGIVRYNPDTPTAILDFIFVEVMQWAQQSNFSYVNLGEAPLANWHSDQHIEMRSELMSLAFQFGRHFFSYQGLRNYKDRFQPDWRPLFVAWPAEKPLNTVLSDIAHLIGSSTTSPKKKLLS